MILNLVKDDFGFQVTIEVEGQEVGHISLEKDLAPDEYTIIDANIDSEFRGRGLYQKMIMGILEQVPSIKINSVFRSKEAERAWMALLNKLPNHIKVKKIPLKLEKTTLYQIMNK